MLKEIISLFYPQNCAGCKKPVHKSEWAICLTCRIKMPQTKYLKSEENPVKQLLLGKCDVEHAFSFYNYQKGQRVQDLMYALKYQGVTQVGDEFGQIIGQHIKKEKRYSNIDFVIPLPLHISKQRIRGYNQCDSIARNIAAIISATYAPKFVKRIRATESQTKKSHFERHQNSVQIFKIKKPVKFEGKSVLLVDDVITTGSTLASLAQEFNSVDKCKVFIVTVAIAT